MRARGSLGSRAGCRPLSPCRVGWLSREVTVRVGALRATALGTGRASHPLRGPVATQVPEDSVRDSGAQQTTEAGQEEALALLDGCCFLGLLCPANSVSLPCPTTLSCLALPALSSMLWSRLGPSLSVSTRTAPLLDSTGGPCVSFLSPSRIPVPRQLLVCVW